MRTSDCLGRWSLAHPPPHHPSPSPPHSLLLPTSCLQPPQRRRSRSTPSSRASALWNRGGGARSRGETSHYPQTPFSPCEPPYLSTARARPVRSDVGRATALKRAVQRPSDKVGGSDGVHREEGDSKRALAPHYAHSTSRSSVASVGEEACKAARKAGGREGVYEDWESSCWRGGNDTGRAGGMGRLV